MDAVEALKTRRSIRRFEKQDIPVEDLKSIVDAGRLAATGGNLQPWEFLLVDDKKLCEEVFSSLGWIGGHVPDKGERPEAYIIVLGHKKEDGTTYVASLGAAVENMQLAAWAMGIGSCWFGSVKRKPLIEYFNIPDFMELSYVLALGYPKESPILSEAEGNSFKPAKNKEGILVVPKRALKDVLHVNKLSPEVKPLF